VYGVLKIIPSHKKVEVEGENNIIIMRFIFNLYLRSYFRVIRSSPMRWETKGNRPYWILLVDGKLILK
jgi:hypothetical protein